MTMPFVPDAEDEDTTDATEEAGATTRSADEDDRDELMKAAQAALDASGRKLEDDVPKPKKQLTAEGEDDEEKEGRDPKGRFTKQAPPAAKPGAPAKPSSTIAQALQEREAKRAIDSAAQEKMAEADQLLSRAREVITAVEARERAADEKHREAEALVQSLHRDPMALLQRAGWTPDDFINKSIASKDPAYQETVRLREELTKSASLVTTMAARLEALEGKAKQYDEAGKNGQAAQELQEFWTSLPEDSPVFQDFDDQDDILYQARKVRQRYYNETGKVASPAKVAEYLHYRALLKRNGAPAETAGPKPRAGQLKAKVPRALGSNQASERRSGTGKHVHDMSPEEEREYLMTVGEAAVAGSSD